MNKQFPGRITTILGYLTAVITAFALPRVTKEPADQFVSLGPTVTFSVFASGVAPLSYQWRFNDAEIAGATKRTLSLTNVVLTNAGGYTVLVTDISGTVTSHVAHLDVDPTFTMITGGPVVNDMGTAVGAAWGDYNNDGFPDLLAGNLEGPFDFLYLNKGDGVFERVFTNIVGRLDYGLGAWGDYDNDGFLDLYTVKPDNTGVHLYHNQGNGILLKLTNTLATGPITSDRSQSFSLAWGDYDNDGFLDMIVGNGRGNGSAPEPHFLFHNQGDGTFAKITSGGIVTDRSDTWSVTWADYDDDGRLDAFVANDLGENNQLYHNDGSGKFTAMSAAQVGSLVAEGGDSRGAAWGDYDNDGYVDLFVSHGPNNLLYHNNGNGTFTKITDGAIVNDTTPFKSHGCFWVDYDNDGYLDLFALNVVDTNFLYHNNGDGTFTRITRGSLVNDPTEIVSVDAGWADYDNDGFMDVFIANDGKNSLFHNNGNTNHWINVKLVGTASNRAAIGAKVRIMATIGGKAFWQRRDIAGGGSMAGQSDLRASFGLGDGTDIDLVRIEWPSGTVQELHNIACNQFLVVIEPARMKSTVIGGEYHLTVNGGVGFTYDVQASTNLIDWVSDRSILTTNMSMPVISTNAVLAPQMYFRAMRK